MLPTRKTVVGLRSFARPAVCAPCSASAIGRSIPAYRRSPPNSRHEELSPHWWCQNRRNRTDCGLVYIGEANRQKTVCFCRRRGRLGNRRECQATVVDHTSRG